MFQFKLLLLGLASGIVLTQAQSEETEVGVERGGQCFYEGGMIPVGNGESEGHKKPCKGCEGKPTGFPFYPCPVSTRLAGTVKLGGDVDFGSMDLSIDGSVLNNCGGTEPCKKAKLSVKSFVIDHMYYKKNRTYVDQAYPPVSRNCSVCDIILTFPEHDKPNPPEHPKCKCDIAANFIAAIDVSKSMAHPKNNPKATRRLVSMVARRFSINPKKTHFALTTFGDDARIEWKLNQKTAKSQKLTQIGISEVQFTNKFSNHAAAIDSAVTQFKAYTARHVPNLFVLFADGKPNKDIRRLEKAIKRLRCLPKTCFAIVGINTKANSEEALFFRYLLGCPKKGPCPQLFLVVPTKKDAAKELADELTEFLCKCCKGPHRVEEQEAVTTFTVRIADRTLPDFGSRSELNATIDEMLYNAAEATGVTPDRLTAIAIEDTLGNVVGADEDSIKRLSSGAESGPAATMVEVMFEEPGLNDEGGSQETVRRLSTMLKEKTNTLKDRLMERGIVDARIERMAIRQNDGNMPIVDVLQV